MEQSMYKTTSKQGSFQITDDGYAQVVPIFTKTPLWTIPVSSIKLISVQRGAIMCSIAIHADSDHIVETLTKKDIEHLRAVLSMVAFQEVSVLPQQVYQQPQMPVNYAQQPAYQQPQQPVFAPQMETKVKTYKTPRDYQRDVTRMQRAGWSVQNSLDHHKDRSMAYKLFVPFGVFSGGTGQIVVTYQRPRR
jgi:hypothetical protein